MLNKIIDFSLHNRTLVLLSTVLLFLVGAYVAVNMEVDVFPDLTAPTVVVMTEANGMAAEEVERLVTFPIETSVNGATNVRRVRSSSTTGFSIVWVEFDWGTDIYRARQIVNEKIVEAANDLPVGVGAPTLGPQSSILGEVLFIGLTADSTTSLQELRTIADWTIAPRLLSTGGVAQVSVLGGEVKEYQILLNPAKMKAYGISVNEVVAATENMNQNTSGGVLYEYGNEYIIRGVVATDNVHQIATNVVANRDSYPVLLSDIAEVRVGNKTPKLGAASEKGKPAVIISITKQPNTNTLELTDKLVGVVEKVEKELPADVNVSTDIFRQANFINNSISNIERALIEGSIFVIIILFIFLMNWRTTAISLIAMPLSLIVAVLALKIMGFTLNTMSLGGMVIAIGSLVDDAIIDVENVFRRLRENAKLAVEKRTSSIKIIFDASVEIRASIVKATIITIVTFVPLFFLSGMEGRMLRPLGISFVVSLFASLLVAITLTPVLCSYLLTDDKLLKKHETEPKLVRKLKEYYTILLEKSFEHKKLLLSISGGLLLMAVISLFFVGRSFLPTFNEGSLTISCTAVPGISLEESDKLALQVEKLLMEVPEVTTVGRKTGRAELDEHSFGVNISEIEVPFDLKDRTLDEFMEDIRQRLSAVNGLNFEIGQPISHRIDHMLSGSKANVAIKLFGDDLTQLYTSATDIKNAIGNIEGVADLNIEQQIEAPQLQIIPKREMLARYGIPLNEFADMVNIAFSGRVVSQVVEKGQVFDLTLKTSTDAHSDMESIGNYMLDVNIDGEGPQKVPLSYVADVVSAKGAYLINREDVQRRIVISANVAGRDLDGVVKDIQSAIGEKVKLPQNYYVVYGGQFESAASASQTLTIVFIFVLIVIFVILHQEFKSTKISSLILVNLPLALIGGVAMIWMTSGIMSIPSIIGFISLFGIATRNGILLVSHYEQLLKEDHDLKHVLIQGSLDRLNPILMTALCSALALIPLALNGDQPGNEIQSPMAQVILGGLVTSTLLNGFIVPIIYSLIKRKG